MDAKSIIGLNPKIKLNNGQLIPQVGLGVYKLAGESAEPLLHKAFEVGYRRIDTAAFYGNEPQVGAAVRNSGLPREEIFVTTKVWKDDHGYERALAAIDESLARLDTEYIDMLLIHWPCPSQNLYLDTWKAFEKVLADGLVRNIGISNFQPNQLSNLWQHAEVKPTINQVELHPFFQQLAVRAANTEHGVLTEAWSPLARAGKNDNPTLLSISEETDRTVSQVIIPSTINLT